MSETGGTRCPTHIRKELGECMAWFEKNSKFLVSIVRNSLGQQNNQEKPPPFRLPSAHRCCVDACPICCDSAAMKVQVNREGLGQFCRQRGFAPLEHFGWAC